MLLSCEYHYVEEVTNIFLLCAYCRLPLVQPVDLECTCKMCNACLELLVVQKASRTGNEDPASDNEVHCPGPECGEGLSTIPVYDPEEKRVQKIMRQVESLDVYCVFKYTDQCDWQGKRINLGEHLQQHRHRDDLISTPASYVHSLHPTRHYTALQSCKQCNRRMPFALLAEHQCKARHAVVPSPLSDRFVLTIFHDVESCAWPKRFTAVHELIDVLYKQIQAKLPPAAVTLELTWHLVYAADGKEAAMHLTPAALHQLRLGGDVFVHDAGIKKGAADRYIKLLVERSVRQWHRMKDEAKQQQVYVVMTADADVLQNIPLLRSVGAPHVLAMGSAGALTEGQLRLVGGDAHVLPPWFDIVSQATAIQRQARVNATAVVTSSSTTTRTIASAPVFTERDARCLTRYIWEEYFEAMLTRHAKTHTANADDETMWPSVTRIGQRLRKVTNTTTTAKTKAREEEIPRTLTTSLGKGVVGALVKYAEELGWVTVIHPGTPQQQVRANHTAETARVAALLWEHVGFPQGTTLASVLALPHPPSSFKSLVLRGTNKHSAAVCRFKPVYEYTSSAVCSPAVTHFVKYRYGGEMRKRLRQDVMAMLPKDVAAALPFPFFNIRVQFDRGASSSSVVLEVREDETTMVSEECLVKCVNVIEEMMGGIMEERIEGLKGVEQQRVSKDDKVLQQLRKDTSGLLHVYIPRDHDHSGVVVLVYPNDLDPSVIARAVSHFKVHY